MKDLLKKTEFVVLLIIENNAIRNMVKDKLSFKC